MALQRPAEVLTAGPSSASATADEEEQEDRDFATDMRAKAQAKQKAMAPEAAQVTCPAPLTSFENLSANCS